MVPGRTLKLILAFVAGLTGPVAATAQGRSFVAEGTDTIWALGARYIAMGGTGASTADDPYAVYYNPANLAWIDRPVLSVTRQLDAKLRPYSFIGGAVPLPFLEPLGLDVTLGFARYNRVHVRSSGAFGENEPESIFLRILLPGISGVYDGDIDSKTIVNRFALGIAPEAIPGLNIGFNIDRIVCETETCGVYAGSAGVESRSIRATAWSYGVGATYKLGRFTLAGSLTDIDARLDVLSTVTDDKGTRPFNFSVGFPQTMMLEAAYEHSDRLRFAAGFRRFWGTYGNFDIDIQTGHFGVEYEVWDGITARGGAWAPIKMHASNGLGLKPPAPAAPTFGLGWERDNLEADLAMFFHPLMSMHKGTPSVSSELTISYRF